MSTGGASGGPIGVDRPPFNTGTGFFVRDGKLYDGNGIEFRIRGVNKHMSEVPSPGIVKTHANTVRWHLHFAGEYDATLESNIQHMQDTAAQHMVPMPGNWEGTCSDDPAVLTTIVDRWVDQANAWRALDGQMILNIANEWGPWGSVVWRDSYITAVGRLRDAGYTCTIAVDAGGCGQDNADLVQYAQDVFDSDPQRNVIFGQHIYGEWSNGGGADWQMDLNTGLDNLAALGLVFYIGEFGPGRNIGPSPTEITPSAVIQAAEARDFGWLAWAWDDPATDVDENWFALSYTGDYNSSDDLTAYGREVVESPGFGLLALAEPATSL